MKDLKSPWHNGELALQRRLGVDERMARVGPMVIRPFMPDQHRLFFEQLPFVVAATVDDAGEIWASLWSGPAGFARSPDPRHLDLDVTLESSDPTRHGAKDGAAVGLLGIELETRRRNRMNGHILSQNGGLRVEVQHSFGNCPKYITRRALEPVTPTSPVEVHTHAGLPQQARDHIASADTFYVASYVDRPAQEGGRQIDISHRGGRPGFVHVADDGTLTIPDFLGNKFFNTLGNFMLNPRAALVFTDFSTGTLIHLTGRAEVLLEDPRTQAFKGAERLWRFKPTQTIVRHGAFCVRAKLLDPSPNNARTGTWAEAASQTAEQDNTERMKPPAA